MTRSAAESAFYTVRHMIMDVKRVEVSSTALVPFMETLLCRNLSKAEKVERCAEILEVHLI